jgi:hypothetical protein
VLGCRSACPCNGAISTTTDRRARISPRNRRRTTSHSRLAQLHYVPTNKFDTGVTFGLEQNDIVNLANTSSINNARLRTYSVSWNWGVRPGRDVERQPGQLGHGAAAVLHVLPTRDLVSYIYTLSTNILTNISPKLRFDLTHLIRLQSRGSFRADEEGIRRFGKSTEFNTLDLVLREQYTPTPTLTFEISQRLSVNPQYEFTGTEGAKTVESGGTNSRSSAASTILWEGRRL